MVMNVVQSQRMQVLLHALQSRTMATRQSPLQLLQAQHCIVPNVAVEQWLKQQVAEQLGISAHWQFHYGVRSFQWYAYQQVLPEKDRVRKANMPVLMMKWRIYQHLQQFWQNHQLHIAAEHPLQPLLNRVAHSAADLAAEPRAEKIHRMLYWLSEQISKLFSHYVIYRGQCQHNCSAPCRCQHNWLQQWGDGKALPLEQLLALNPSPTTTTQATSDQNLKSQSLKSQAIKNQDTNNTATTPSDAATQWANVQGLEAWQANVWRALFHQDWLEMQRIDQQLWQQLEDAATQKQALATLPAQLTIFTLSELAPSQLHFLRRLAQQIDILILHFNPSQEYWADTVDPNWKKQYDVGVKQRYLAQHPQASDTELARFFQQFTLYFNAELRESRHPLLTRFGKQARDHFSLLANLSAGDEGHWVDAFVDDFPNTLLGHVQRDILYLNDALPSAYSLEPQDQSIQIHVCHSALRQLEVLKNQVLDWLSQDSRHRPSDVLVLCPQLKQLEPFIRSVFGSDPKQAGYLPIKIAGVAPHDHVLAWQAICTRMQLLQGRFQPQQLADWLSLPATMQRYAIDATQIERMLQLLSDAGFRRGFDAVHLQQSLDAQDHDYRFSFQFALDRLALGIAIPEHTVFAGTLSFAGVHGADFELIATLIEIFQHLRERRYWLTFSNQTSPVAQHIQCILAEIDEFVLAGVEHLQSVREQAQKLWRMYGLATVNNQSQLAALKDLQLPLSAVLDELSHNVEAQFEQALPTGFITFAEIGQLRPLPYKLMVLLNLDNGSFPSRQRHSAFDLMQLLRPQLGDRSRLEDDQGAFLDALLLAEQQLWLFYNGFDVADAEIREPSAVLQELLDHLAVIVDHEGEASLAPQVSIDGLPVAAHLSSLYRVHPLQPFDSMGFQAQHHRYQDQWYAVAQQLISATGQRQSPLLSQNGTATLVANAMETNVPQCIDARQWIADILFPARLYLKQLGIQNIGAEQDYPDQEALLLDGLARHHLRDFMLNAAPELAQHIEQNQTNDLNPSNTHTVTNTVALLQDQLPVGKMQQAALSRVQQEYAALQSRMQKYATEPTVTTQKTYSYDSAVIFNLTLPSTAATDWVSIQASAGRGRRRAQVWLEYLFWCLWQGQHQPDQDTQALRRVVVFNDVTVICQGITQAQAQQYFAEWITAWRYAEQQVLVLPAELLMQLAKPNTEPEWEMEDEYHRPCNLEALLKAWSNSFNVSGIDMRDKEDSRFHRDWQFLLQYRADDALLTQACLQFAHALYQPIFTHLQVE